MDHGSNHILVWTSLSAKSKKTILHKAAERKLAEVVQAILSHQEFSEINARDTHKMTALHYSAWKGDIHSCQAIVFNANFCGSKAMDSVGKTALHYAEAGGFADVCQLLLDNMDIVGVRLGDRKLQTAAQRASKCGYNAIASLIDNFVNAYSDGASRNQRGEPVAPGTCMDNKNCTHLLYCGRHLLPNERERHCNGYCGPNNGPQCHHCLGLTAAGEIPTSEPSIGVIDEHSDRPLPSSTSQYYGDHEEDIERSRKD